MSIEHNVVVKTQKSPFEADDLSSTDIKYVQRKSNDDSVWNEIEDNPIGNSTMLSELNDKPSTSSYRAENSHELRPRIKNEPIEQSSSVKCTQNAEDNTDDVEELFYDNFKAKYLKKVDRMSLKCLACNRMVIRTSVCAHLRLWHATTMMFNCELCDVGFRRSDYRQRHMAFSHPNDYKCIKCTMQFHHSSLYKEHMYEAHHLVVNVQMLKKRDETDVPLEKMKFSVHVPESMRVS
jgi:hypothetical protein